jgi:Family of unknown function (DUF6496)
MPEKKTRERAARRKTPSSKAGEYVREEMEHIREGKHGARSTRQAIAIGLSKARRAGVNLPPPPGGKKPAKSSPHRKPSARRSSATLHALQREGRGAASREALSEHSRSVARKRGAAARQTSARKAVRTKGAAGRSAAARKAARTRARSQ